MPYLEVSPPLIEYGPSPAIGEIFDLNILIKNLAQEWQLVGIEFRLGYDNALLEVVSITEGSFLRDPRWNWYGTTFIAEPWVIVGNMLLPNPVTGEWDQTEFPNGQGTVATIRFRVIYQGVYPQIDSCILNLFNVRLIDKNSIEIPSEEPLDGLYTIIGSGYHDITITHITPSKTIIGQGYNFTANINITNQGTFTENFTLFSTCGFIRRVVMLAPGTETTIDNIVGTSKLRKGNYRLFALVLPCFGDCNPTDNIRIEGAFFITIPGDVNGDHKCDMVDIVQLILHFGCKLGQPCYVSNCDIDGDGIINMVDIVIAILHFQQKW